MVLLTMTPSMVQGLKKLQSLADTRAEATTTATMIEIEHSDNKTDKKKSAAFVSEDGEPDISEPAVAAPISHSQVLRLWKSLQEQREQRRTNAQGDEEYEIADKADTDDTPTLEKLLVGAKVYVPPRPPKPEPTAAYKALMARLRRDEEAREYERMVNPPDLYTTSFAQVNRPVYADDTGDDGVTYSDVNRQVMLIFNFLLTMLGVAYALWVLARWWPTPPRLFLALGGSIAVGIAEYGLYAGYVWHLSEAAKKEKEAPSKEVREVVQTWTVGAGTAEDETTGKTSGIRGDNDVTIPDGTGASGIDIAQARRRKK